MTAEQSARSIRRGAENDADEAMTTRRYDPEAARDDILEATEGKQSGKRNKRGAMSVAKFRIIGRLAWTRENGLEDDDVSGNKASVFKRFSNRGRKRRIRFS